jgi:multidrug resistance protein MdtO
MQERAQDRILTSILQQELAPYPGRMSGSLRDTLAAVLAVILCMTLQVPGVSLALALMFLLQRDHPGVTLRTGLMIVLGPVTAAGASILWVQFTDGTETARFLGFMIGIFIAAFCTNATRFPLFWSIFGFYGALDMAAWDTHRTPDAIVASILYNLASLTIVVCCTIAVEYAFSMRQPVQKLQREMQERLRSLATFFHALADTDPGTRCQGILESHKQLTQYANAGDVYLNELYDRIRNSNPQLAQVPLGIHYRIGLLTRILDKASMFGYSTLSPKRADHRAEYRAIAQLCDQMLVSAPPSSTEAFTTATPLPLREIVLELHQYANIPPTVQDHNLQVSPERQLSGSFKLFHPGALNSAEIFQHALKLTLAATLCYILFNAVAWPGIATCMVTVLFTGLTSTGAMKQKQLYRIVGAAIGGILGIVVVSLFFPNMDSITALTMVVAPVAFLSGWVLRSPRISYVGVQIGFAFFLTALPGFTATTELAPARDRVIGIALGILTMWFIFDQLWPTRTSDALRSILSRIEEAAEQLRSLLDQPALQRDKRTFDELRSLVSSELAKMQQLLVSVYFESGWHRKREIAQSRRLVQQIEASSAGFYALALQADSTVTRHVMNGLG